MAAVVGLTYDQVKTVLKERSLGMIDIANLNSFEQIVISGKKRYR